MVCDDGLVAAEDDLTTPEDVLVMDEDGLVEIEEAADVGFTVAEDGLLTVVVATFVVVITVRYIVI